MEFLSKFSCYRSEYLKCYCILLFGCICHLSVENTKISVNRCIFYRIVTLTYIQGYIFSVYSSDDSLVVHLHVELIEIKTNHYNHRQYYYFSTLCNLLLRYFVSHRALELTLRTVKNFFSVSIV